jgi:hypothetical protein
MNENEEGKQIGEGRGTRLPGRTTAYFTIEVLGKANSHGKKRQKLLKNRGVSTFPHATKAPAPGRHDHHTAFISLSPFGKVGDLHQGCQQPIMKIGSQPQFPPQPLNPHLTTTCGGSRPSPHKIEGEASLTIFSCGVSWASAATDNIWLVANEVSTSHSGS